MLGMKQWNTEVGFSRLEVLCMISIVIMMLFFVYEGMQWMIVRQEMGEDKLLLKNARNTAKVEMMNDPCPVYGCDGGDTCTHRIGGTYIGYFDRPTNKIKAVPSKGYNESTKMEIDGMMYYGKKKTMVIKIQVHDHTIEYSWVVGKK